MNCLTIRLILITALYLALYLEKNKEGMQLAIVTKLLYFYDLYYNIFKNDNLHINDIC